MLVYLVQRQKYVLFLKAPIAVQLKESSGHHPYSEMPGSESATPEVARLWKVKPWSSQFVKIKFWIPEIWDCWSYTICQISRSLPRDPRLAGRKITYPDTPETPMHTHTYTHAQRRTERPDQYHNHYQSLDKQLISNLLTWCFAVVYIAISPKWSSVAKFDAGYKISNYSLTCLTIAFRLTGL